MKKLVENPSVLSISDGNNSEGFCTWRSLWRTPLYYLYRMEINEIQEVDNWFNNWSNRIRWVDWWFLKSDAASCTIGTQELKRTSTQKRMNAETETLLTESEEKVRHWTEEIRKVQHRFDGPRECMTNWWLGELVVQAANGSSEETRSREVDGTR